MESGTPWLVLALAPLIAGLAVAARRSGIASPILAVGLGALLSFTPAAPERPLDPDLVLMVLLPPLLYISGVSMSWRGFRSNLRPILLLAVGCVIVTTAGVAAVAHWALGLPWAVGFVLGAIVSPPDAVAPMAIARRLGLPRRVLTILEGESLVNDATALVLLSFAVGAVVTGSVPVAGAALRFGLIVVGELGWGIAVGWAMLRLRHLAQDPRAEVLLALATPFFAFWLPHGLGGSGVIACVAAGLWVSWNGRNLIRPETRLQGFFIWGLVSWGVEALVFLLTGLEARRVVEGLGGGLWPALGAALAVCVTVVAVRFLWVFPATTLPRLLIPGLARRDPVPDWRVTFVIAFTGLRGAVSLAAALSVPRTLGEGAFPDRDLILFITFCVIVATLAGLGGLMPWVIRRLRLGEAGEAEALENRRDEHQARLAGLDEVLAELDRAEAEAGPIPEALASLRRHYRDRRAHFARTADEGTQADPVAEVGGLQLRLVEAERAVIGRAYEANRLTDEARRRIERELDLETARVRNLLGEG